MERLKRKYTRHKIYDFAVECGLRPLKITTAPEVKGKNIEYVILLEKSLAAPEPLEKLIKGVKL